MDDESKGGVWTQHASGKAGARSGAAGMRSSRYASFAAASERNSIGRFSPRGSLSPIVSVCPAYTWT